NLRAPRPLFRFADHRLMRALRLFWFRALLEAEATTTHWQTKWSAAVRRKVPHQMRCVMKSALMQLSVPLSHLVPSRRNPRKVKPGREAHQRLVALIRSQGLLQPRVVRPAAGKPKRYEVVAGDRRLRALKEIHGNDGDPKILCVLRDVDAATAD